EGAPDRPGTRSARRERSASRRYPAVRPARSRPRQLDGADEVDVVWLEREQFWFGLGGDDAPAPPIEPDRVLRRSCRDIQVARSFATGQRAHLLEQPRPQPLPAMVAA